MKLRVLPIILTVAASAIVLFGGWLLYNQFAVDAPMQKVIKQVEGIASSDAPVIDNKRVTIKLQLDSNANLKTVYDAISKQGKDVIGDRELVLDIKNNDSSEQLDELWSSVLFDVAEAMETKTYSDIPAAMERLANENKGVNSVTEMDDTNVYITIKNESSSKYIVLPRTPVQLEVSAYA